MNRKVDFFIAGVQKGGTTALWHFLRSHPDIGLPEPKELHFFDNEALDWRDPPYAKLHGHFSGFEDRAVLGEATPIYCYWPNSLERIQRYNSAAKIILLFRHPAMRAFSHWRMEKVRGADTLSFSEAIRAGRSRVADDSTAPGYHRVFSYIERGFYSEQVRRLRRLFPASQTLLLSQEGLLRDHGETLGRVYDFLEIKEPKLRVEKEIVFSHESFGSELAREDREYLDSLFYEDLKKFNELTGIDFSEERLRPA